MKRAQTQNQWVAGDTPLGLDLSANLDDLVKALAVARNQAAEWEAKAKGLADSIRQSVPDLGEYPCANGLTLTLARNRRWSADRALAYVTANEALARQCAQYVLTVDRSRLEALAPEIAEQCWDEYDARVTVK